MTTNKDLSPELEQYLDLCKQIYERMEREGSWPWPDWESWPDSHHSGDMLDSNNNSIDL